MRHLPTLANTYTPISFIDDPASFVGDMMRSFFTPGNGRTGSWNPAVDVVETAQAYQLSVDVPGFDPEGIEVSLAGDTLTLKGERKSEARSEDERAHVIERSHGSFHRTFTFPAPVVNDSVEAEAKNGVLTITVAKAKEAQARKVRIKNG